MNVLVNVDVGPVGGNVVCPSSTPRHRCLLRSPNDITTQRTNIYSFAAVRTSSRMLCLLSSGDLPRCPGVVPKPGAPAWVAGFYPGTSLHGDKQPLRGRQHDGPLRGECLADPLAGGPRECRAEGLATHREQH